MARSMASSAEAPSPRCDASFVGLYVPQEQAGPFATGAARFLDVRTAPPRRGRPQVADTLSLSEVVKRVVSLATDTEDQSWGEAEED